jgi:hypothetical protein
MMTSRLMLSIALILLVPAASSAADQKMNLGENAALRYWSAFAQMQDAAISDQQVKELNLILEGTAPYDDLKYKDLVEKNRLALKTMARGTTLARCNWGVDYQLGPEAPVDYVRKALTLGRLNVLYAFHLAINGDLEGAISTLAVGLRFSHDVANEGTLFATLAARSLILEHLMAVNFGSRHGFSSTQRELLRNALATFEPDGLDWRAAMQRELSLLSPSTLPGLDSRAWPALQRITPAYLRIFDNPSTLPELQKEIASAPQALQDLIPNPKRELEAKEDLAAKLAQTRKLLQ